MSKKEPKPIKSSCPYCGDAPINHNLIYFENLVSTIFDSHIQRVAVRAPKFLKNFVDWFSPFTFRTFAFFHLAHFSNDIEKSNTFRSVVIWEEANRRGIPMEQLILFEKPIDYYRAKVKAKGQEKFIYFHSVPLPPEAMEMIHNWDDKFILKQKLAEAGVPAPFFIKLPVFSNKKTKNLEEIFTKLTKPVIVKPKIGSRGRHTTTNINTFEELLRAIEVGQMISPHLVVEEHLSGYVCRATLVKDKLMGFYRGEAPYIVGDGVHSVIELIEEKNKNKPERVEEIKMTQEIQDFISRFGHSVHSIPKNGENVSLTHRVGRLFGGRTKEMLDELHPSFIPIFEKASRMTGLVLAGFDCIIPDPTKPADSQKWGIIECNTLPFIDLHYYALEGKPQNIAGAIWDFWK
ncbi:hypothetical protein K2P96_01565 [Patescibacteria group bacterium]|nr:hypothetical protein [Patescibacteria group bacterium]